MVLPLHQRVYGRCTAAWQCAIVESQGKLATDTKSKAPHYILYSGMRKNGDNNKTMSDNSELKKVRNYSS